MPRPYISGHLGNANVGSSFVRSNTITSPTILQQNHGFSVGSLVYFDRWWKLASNTSAKLPIAVISEVENAHRFKYITSGVLTLTAHGFAVGSRLYTDANGALTTTNANTNILVGVASDANTILVSLNQVFGLDKMFTNTRAKGDLVRGQARAADSTAVDPGIVKVTPNNGYLLSTQTHLGNTQLSWSLPTHNRDPLAELSIGQFGGTKEAIMRLNTPLPELSAIVNVFEELPNALATINTWRATGAEAEQYVLEDLNGATYNVTLDATTPGTATATKSAGNWLAAEANATIIDGLGGVAIITGATGSSSIAVQIVSHFASTSLTAPEVRLARFAPHLQLSGTPGSYTTENALVYTNNINVEQWTQLLDFTPTFTAPGSSTLYFAIGLIQATTGYEYWYSVASILSSDTPRVILRREAGNYEYNDNASFSLTTWNTSAAPTNLASSLREAFAAHANNQTSGAQLDTILPNLMPSLTGMQSLRVAAFLQTTGADTPTISGIEVTYNSNTMWQKNTDRNVEILDLNTIKISANNAAQRNVHVTVSR